MTAAKPAAARSGSEVGVLVTAELGQQPAARAQQASRAHDEAPDDGEPVVAAVERTARLVGLHVGGQEPDLAGGDVRGHCGHEVEGVGAQRAVEVAGDGRHAVAAGARHGVGVDVDAHDDGAGHLGGQVGRPPRRRPGAGGAAARTGPGSGAAAVASAAAARRARSSVWCRGT